MLTVRALFSVLVLPGIFAGIVPWVVAAYDPWRGDGCDLGAVLVGAGIGIVILCVRDFLVIGRNARAVGSAAQARRRGPIPVRAQSHVRRRVDDHPGSRDLHRLAA